MNARAIDIAVMELIARKAREAIGEERSYRAVWTRDLCAALVAHDRGVADSLVAERLGVEPWVLGKALLQGRERIANDRAFGQMVIVVAARVSEAIGAAIGTTLACSMVGAETPARLGRAA